MDRRAFLLVSLLYGMPCAQASDWERAGAVSVNRTHVKWGSPEALVQGLRSSDSAVRISAVQAMGIDVTNFRSDYFEEIVLRYASFGEQRPGEYPVRNAIVEVVTGDRVIVAVAVPGPDAWEQTVAFDCIRKYAEAPILNSFLTLDLVYHQPHHLFPIDLSARPLTEIVLRSVFGGTGLYQETEDRFELEKGGARHVLSFVSRRDAFVYGSGETEYERRWFKDNQLVETKATLRDRLPENFELDAGHFKTFNCTPYKWDSANFRYIPAGPAKACAARTP